MSNSPTVNVDAIASSNVAGPITSPAIPLNLSTMDAGRTPALGITPPLEPTSVSIHGGDGAVDHELSTTNPSSNDTSSKAEDPAATMDETHAKAYSESEVCGTNSG
jgi:hypothetical protein